MNLKFLIRHCSNGSTTDLSFDFEDAADVEYGWTGIDACCNCGGGKSVYDNVAVSFVNNNNFNASMTECTFKLDILAKGIEPPFQTWNNFVLYQLIGDIKSNSNLNKDILIFTELDNLDRNVVYEIIICNFEGYDYSLSDPTLYTDFWLFASIQYVSQSIYLINSEWFSIDEYILSDQIIIDNRSYSFCNSLIQNSTDDGIVDLITPCFEDSLPTMSPTNPPTTYYPTLGPTLEPS